MTDVFKKAATQEATAIRENVEKAARSGAYLYPLRGIIFFLSHKTLWKPLLEKLAPTVTLGIGITTFMFVLTYLPQVAILALFSGPAAPFSAAALVLSESQTLFNILSKSFVIGDALVDTFDGVSFIVCSLPEKSVYHKDTRFITSSGPVSKEHDEHRERRPPGQIWFG